MKEQIQKLSIRQRTILGFGVGATILTGVTYSIGPERVVSFISEAVKDPCLKEDTQALVQECKDKRTEKKVGKYIDW